MFNMMLLFVTVVMGYGPCEYEDSYACYWLADQMGDGEGRSFIIGPETDGGNDYRWIVYQDEVD